MSERNSPDSAGHRLKFLLLAEGNSETRDSWSGSTKSVVDAIRADGNSVTTADVDLYGWRRACAAAATFTPNVPSWRTRFRLGGVPFAIRSARARDLLHDNAHTVDLVLQIGATFALQPNGGAAKAEKPYVLYCDSNIAMAGRLASLGHSHASWLASSELRAIKERESRVYTGALRIFTISERLRRSFIEDFGVAADRVVTVYAGANFSSLPSGAPQMNGPRPPRILFVGRHFERKGGPAVLEAFRRVRASHPSAELIVAGPRDFQSSEPGVTSLGWLDKDRPDDLARLVQEYSKARVFCMPTLFDAFGVVYLEAMQYGIPCIGSNVYAVPEIIADGETGFVVDPHDVDLLSKRLTALIEDDGLAARMGEAGRERVRRLFTWQAVSARIVDHCRAALS